MIQNWQEYYSQTKNRPPSRLLTRALSFVQNKNTALDLGSGALNDSKFLISQGFNKVLAVDKEYPPRKLLLNLPENIFEFICTPFDQFKFPAKEFSIINAQYSLPFGSPKTFSKVWNCVLESLTSSGIFTGQFFGIHDQWNVKKRDMTFHSKTDVENLLDTMEILELREEEKDGKLANGEKKHWHVFHVIAKA